MGASRYVNSLLACVALAAAQGCSKGGGPCLFVHRGTLFQASADEVKTIGPVGRDAFLDPEGSLSWTVGSPKDEWLSYDGYGTSVDVHRLDGENRLALVRRFDLPEGQAIKTTAMSGHILFATGHLGKHTLGLFDTREENAILVPVEIPEQVKHKAFDDLIVDGTHLLAVDKVIMPKWLVRYDISNPAKPKPAGVTELMAGLNEHVVKGVIGARYLALFCESLWDGGQAQSLQIYDKSKSFAPQATICLWMSSDRGENRGCRSSPQMSFAGDLLLLAGYGEGVGVLACSDSLSEDAVPGRLFCRDEDGKERPVLDAVSLPTDNRVVVWLTEGQAPSVVGFDRLVCRQEKPDTQIHNPPDKE